MEHNQSKFQYINHMLNNSPSKMGYSFSKYERFKGQGTNRNPQPTIVNKFFTYDRQPKQSFKKSQNKSMQKSEVYESEGIKKKKEDYHIFPVRRDINDLIRQMQDLRIYFQTNFQQRKFEIILRKQIDSKSSKIKKSPSKSQDKSRKNILSGSVSKEKQKQPNLFDKFAIKSSHQESTHSRLQKNHLHNDVKNAQNSPRKSISLYGSFAQSNHRNTISYSFGNASKKPTYIQTNEDIRNSQLYRPFSQFGNLNSR